MKYIVMECHPGYSVLMDEESQFVFAANLHYQVGQSVEQPILLKSSATVTRSGISVSTRKLIAAAACLLLMAGSGLLYYRTNLAVYSIIVFSAEGDVSIAVNSRGKVLSVKSDDPAGESLIEGYIAKGKDKLTVTNELIQRAVASGKLQTGDTVSLYIQAPEETVYSSYKSELEQELSSYKELRTDIRPMEAESIQLPTPTAAPEPVLAPAVEAQPVVPAAPQTVSPETLPEHPHVKHPAEVQHPEAVKPAILPEEPTVQPTAPAVEPVKPEAVMPDLHPAEQQTKHTEPAPEPPKPAEVKPDVQPAEPQVKLPVHEEKPMEHPAEQPQEPHTVQPGPAADPHAQEPEKPELRQEEPQPVHPEEHPKQQAPKVADQLEETPDTLILEPLLETVLPDVKEHSHP